MLTNTFKKYENVNAIHLKSEQQFLNHLIDNCANDRPFLFGCDSCKIITQFYQQCKSLHQDKDDKFILITADTDYRVKDATVEFKNKFVFFSPKITFGVDFSVPDAQDMYIYMNGQSIQPSGVFQQSTRCRNIQNLYYFGNCTDDLSKYETLDQLKDDVRQCLVTSKTFATACTYLDEDDEFKVIENTFFNLFCYNEFVKDIYESNKLRHFQLILEENGFNMSTEGDKDKANIEIDLDEMTDALFDEFLQSDTPTDKKYTTFMKHIEYLGLDLNDKDTLTKFKEIIQDKHQVKKHDTIIRILKSMDYITSKLNQLQMNGIDVKNMTNVFQKVYLLKVLEQEFGLDFLKGIGAQKDDMNDEFYNLIKYTFRLRNAKPKTRQEINSLYAAMFRSITGDKTLVRAGKKGLSVNKSIFKHHVELNQIKNKTQQGFSPSAIEVLGIQVQQVPRYDLDFLDD